MDARRPAPGRLPEAPNRPSAVTAYLVERPGAAQSFLAAGQVGVPRASPDYIRLTVLNTILGGQYASRINLNLREDKGYTYGSSSVFQFRVGRGPFRASALVATGVTAAALAEMLKELTDITGPRPVTAPELARAKDGIIRGFGARFADNAAIANALTDLVVYDLPDDEFATFRAKLEAVTCDDVNQAARTYLDPSRMTILVVGDRAKVEGSLKTQPFAKAVRVLDAEGNQVPFNVTSPNQATDRAE